jgi:hypothetical protein
MYTYEDIEKPVFLEELAQSHQSKYLQSLTLIYIIPDPINQIINMVVLETLVINCTLRYEDPDIDIKNMDFSQFVIACPATLTALTVEGLELTFNTSPPSRI